MKISRLFIFAFLAFGTSLMAVPSRDFAVQIIYADAPTYTLLANAQVEYRFDYLGDNTLITLTLYAPDGVELAIYTPMNLVAPVGRGSRTRDGIQTWSGKFPAPGIYKAVVSNQTPGPITYQIDISGESVSGFAQIVADAPQATTNVVNQTLTVNLPPGAGSAALRLAIPRAPNTCTHANQIAPVIAQRGQAIKLCANEIYPPLHIVGSNVALFGTDGAIVTSAGRQFAINAEGNNLWIEGVTIQAGADANDVGAFLCQYDECTFPPNPNDVRAGLPAPTIIRGGTIYGGGILLNASNSVVHNVTVRGGTIGIATVNGRNNVIVDNVLNDLNGWGSFNANALNSYFIGNTFNRENHACVTPDGFKFLHGCETSGWVCLACAGNVIARNHCELSGNCFYMSGERGLASNDNKLLANYCAGATDNCFELTFSRGNILLANVTTADANTGASCNYPFWIGGSTVYLGANTWQCAVSVDDSLNDATNSTTVRTLPIFFDGLFPLASPAPTSLPTPSYFRHPLRRW